MTDTRTTIRVTHSPEETRSLGAALGEAVRRLSSDQAIVIALDGELGAGKTTFVSGFLRSFGVEGPVRSPTYTLIEPYERNERALFHLDLYRVFDPRELEMLALRDLLVSGSVLLVEWAERGSNALPTPDLRLTFRYTGDATEELERVLEVTPITISGKELAASLQG